MVVGGLKPLEFVTGGLLFNPDLMEEELVIVGFCLSSGLLLELTPTPIFPALGIYLELTDPNPLLAFN